jgi:hypothetical protein
VRPTIILLLTLPLPAGVGASPVLEQIRANLLQVYSEAEVEREYGDAYLRKVSSSVERHTEGDLEGDRTLFVDILMQESLYRADAANCVRGIVRPIRGGFEEVEACQDLGIAMVNYRTARALGLEPARLLRDVDYAVKAGAAVLAGIKKSYGARELHWWTRYNAATPWKRDRYRREVTRWRDGRTKSGTARASSPSTRVALNP